MRASLLRFCLPSISHLLGIIYKTLTFQNGGLGPINATTAVDSSPVDLWAWFYGLLVLPNYVVMIPPVHCSASSCTSYFLPGPIYLLEPSTDSIQEFPQAEGFVIQNSVGYQREFYPLQRAGKISSRRNAIFMALTQRKIL